MNQRAPTQPANLSAAESEHEFNVKLERSPAAAESVDDRRFPRQAYQARIRAVVYQPPGEAADAAGAGKPCQMLTRDISRGGMSVLHNEQLYPGQQIDAVLADGNERRLEVIWCRRLAADCYSAGCRFVKAK